MTTENGEIRRPTIADREDEYRSRRRLLMISPARVDPFADGMSTSNVFIVYQHLSLSYYPI